MDLSGEEAGVEEWFDLPADRRALDVLAHVMMNLRDLPRYAREGSPLEMAGSLWFPAYLACVESFFMNARLAAEFFVRMPRQDITARTFLPDWEPPPAVAKRLDRVWLMASKHVVHFGRDRVPAAPEDWRQEDISYGGLMRITRDAYKAFTSFVEAYAREDGEHAAYLLDFHRGVRPHTLRELAVLRQGRKFPVTVLPPP